MVPSGPTTFLLLAVERISDDSTNENPLEGMFTAQYFIVSGVTLYTFEHSSRVLYIIPFGSFTEVPYAFPF